MPQKLNDPQKKLELRLKRSDVKKMVNQYRSTRTPGKLKFAHFRLKEILDLLVDNKILNQAILDQLKPIKIENYGLKLYLGHHSDGSYCPGKPGYQGYDTIIACNTKLENKRFEDMLDDTKDNNNDSIIIIGYEKNDPYGDGVDMAQICPPECPKDDPSATDIGDD
jgi:hypothetical protein